MFWNSNGTFREDCHLDLNLFDKVEFDDDMFCVTVLRCQLAACQNTLLAGSRHKEAQVTSCSNVLKVTLQKSTFHFVCVRKENPFELT